MCIRDSDRLLGEIAELIVPALVAIDAGADGIGAHAVLPLLSQQVGQRFAPCVERGRRLTLANQRAEQAQGQDKVPSAVRLSGHFLSLHRIELPLLDVGGSVAVTGRGPLQNGILDPGPPKRPQTAHQVLEQSRYGCARRGEDADVVCHAIRHVDVAGGRIPGDAFGVAGGHRELECAAGIVLDPRAAVYVADVDVARAVEGNPSRAGICLLYTSRCV